MITLLTLAGVCAGLLAVAAYWIGDTMLKAVRHLGRHDEAIVELARQSVELQNADLWQETSSAAVRNNVCELSREVQQGGGRGYQYN